MDGWITILFKLKYSWLTLLFSFLVYSKVIQFIYIYINNPFHILFHYGSSQDTECSSLYCTVGPCFIYFTCCGLYLLIPNS